MMDMCREGSNDEGENRTSYPPSENEFETDVDGGISTVDEVLECLTSSRRRIVLYYLQNNEIAELTELAAHVAAWEDDISLGEVTADDRKQVATQLVHTHLPKLANAQFIEYDQRSDTVRYRDPPSLLHPILRLLARLEGQTSE